MEKQKWDDQKSLREMIKEEQSKTKGMTFGQKLGYFWDYYKIVVVIAILVLFGISIGVTAYRNKNRVINLQAVFLESDGTGGGADFLAEGFMEYASLEEKDSVLLETGITTSEQAGQASMTGRVKIQAYMTTGELDVLVMDERNLQDYGPLGYFVDLRDVFDEEELESLGDAVIWGSEEYINAQGETEEPDGEPYPYAIRVTDSPVLQEAVLYPQGGEVYAAVAVNSSRMEMSEKFFEFLLEK